MLNTQKFTGYLDSGYSKYAIFRITKWENDNKKNNRYIKYPTHLIPQHMKVNDKVLISRENYEKTDKIYTTKKEVNYLLDEDGYILLNENDEVTKLIETPECDKELLALGDAKVGDEFHLYTSKIIINKKCDDFIVKHIHYLDGNIKELHNDYALIEVNSLLIQYPNSLLKRKGIKLQLDDDIYIQGEDVFKI